MLHICVVFLLRYKIITLVSCNKYIFQWKLILINLLCKEFHDYWCLFHRYTLLPATSHCFMQVSHFFVQNSEQIFMQLFVQLFVQLFMQLFLQFFVQLHIISCNCTSIIQQIKLFYLNTHHNSKNSIWHTLTRKITFSWNI